MSLRSYLFGIFTSICLFWGAFLLIFFNTNPYEGGNLIIFSFFGSLFFAVWGTFTLLDFYFRVFISKNEIYYANINIALREGFLFSLCILGLLILKSINFLNFLNGFLLLLAITSLEFYFLAKS